MISACHRFRNKRGRPGFDSQSGRFFFLIFDCDLGNIIFFAEWTTDNCQEIIEIPMTSENDIVLRFRQRSRYTLASYRIRSIVSRSPNARARDGGAWAWGLSTILDVKMETERK
ncbi:hypothetical protein BDV19DRAFT_364196 [Aspergillus venezuelensis]